LDADFVMIRISETDMELVQYHFAIAEVHKYTGFAILETGPAYCIVQVKKESMKQLAENEYSIELPRSAIKETTEPPSISQYKGNPLLLAVIHAETKHLRTFVANMGADIVSVNTQQGYVRVLGSYQELLDLHFAGFEVEVEADLSEREGGPHWLFPEYHTYPEVVSELSQIESDHSSIAARFSLGISYEDRNIFGIKISDNVLADEPEPEAFICALHHAREAATVEVAMYIINYLTDHYGEPGYENVTYLVDNREIYIVPIVNPDGKVYDDSGGGPGAGLYWRKNRQPCSGGIGTDLNRNYSYQWGGSGSSGVCASQIFRGYEPFDAPETAAVRDFVLEHPDITVLLTYHSYGSLVLWPWGYTYDPIADHTDRRVHEIIGQTYAGYTGYTAQQGSDLYITSGTTDDWAYGTTKDDPIPLFTWTVELEGGGFYPAPSTLPIMCETNCQGALYVIECADNPYKVLEDNYSEIPGFFDTNSYFVVGDGAYCTDVLGVGKISYGLGTGGVTENPEGRTDVILTQTEHDTGNLISVGGPAVNPIATEFGTIFGITYNYTPGVEFEIFCEGESIYLNLTQYPAQDICIVYLGSESWRTVMLVWGYGWEGTYAGSVLMGDPLTWQAYADCHLLLLRWIDSNADGLVQMSEITVEVYT
jgi:carboxypeptidase T